MNRATRSHRTAILADVAPVGRGARFARRLAGECGPGFADIAKLPDWLGAPAEVRERVAALAIVLRHRGAIDAELSGPRLAMIAEAIGEDLLDAACDATLPAKLASDAPLPPPERLRAEGEAVLQAALPSCLAPQFPGARDDAAAREIVVQASAIAETLA